MSIDSSGNLRKGEYNGVLFWQAGNDGSGSGLDSDTLDGLNSAQFLRSDAASTAQNDITFSGGAGAVTVAAASDIRIAGGSWTGEYTGGIKIQPDASNSYFQYHGTMYFRNSGGANRFHFDSGGNATFVGSVTANGGFGGSGASLTNVNAATLDSIDSSQFVRSDTGDTLSGNYNTTGTWLIGGTYANNPYNSVSSTRLLFGGGNDQANYHIGTNMENYGGNYTKLDLRWHTGIRMGAQAGYGGLRFYTNEDLTTVLFSVGKGDGNVRVESGELYHNTSGTGDKYWREGNDGSGSGLDADTLDGVQSSGFLRSDQSDTFSGDLTSSGSARILLQKTDNNVSDHIIFYNGTTRVGEIGCHDGSWLRLNQSTGNNIYTPRYIRADGGFFVDGSSKGINGSGNFVGGTISGASDYSTLIRSNADDTVTGHTEWQDNYQVRLGNSADLKVWHNGYSSYIQSPSHTLYIQATTIDIGNGAGNEAKAKFIDNGRVELYYDNDRVFYTETRGVRLADNTKIYENSSHNTAVIQHADIHHAIVLRGATNNNGSSITNENTTTFREYGQFKFRTGAINAYERLTIAANGNIGAPSGSNIYNASDVRLKKNITTLDKGLDIINNLRPVSFNWIDGFCDEEKDSLYGFIAQEVETVDTNLIQAFTEEVKIGEDQENPDQIISNTLRVNEKFIIPILVKALQELTARVKDLEDKNNS